MVIIINVEYRKPSVETKANIILAQFLRNSPPTPARMAIIDTISNGIKAIKLVREDELGNLRPACHMPLDW